MLPQLDFAFYTSQIFWFLVSFGAIVAFNTKFTAKKFDQAILERNNNIVKLSNQIQDMQNELASLENQISQMKAESAKEIAKIQENISAQLQEKRDSISKELQESYNAKILEAKIEIDAFRKDISSVKSEVESIIKDKISSFVPSFVVLDEKNKRLS